LAAALGCLALGCGEPTRSFYPDLEGGGDATGTGVGDGSGSSSGGQGTEGGPDVQADVAADGPGADGQEDATSEAGEDAPLPEDGAVTEAGDGGDGGDGGIAGCAFSCDSTHASTTTCDAAGCHYTCAAGWGNCNNALPDLDGCETNIFISATHCGGCNNVCDTLTSVNAACVGGACTYGPCPSGYADCDTTPPNTNGCETNILTSTTNCGGCTNTCDSSHATGATTCVGGACHYGGCATGYRDCNASTGSDLDGCETDIQISTTNCGGCGNVCNTTHATGTTTCASGACVYAGCATGYSDCNASTAPDLDGCETNTNTSATNCGMCGVTCGTLHATSSVCSGGVCAPTCSAGYANCNTSGGNTTGCECHQPSTMCCGTAPGQTCENVHTNGPASLGYGQSWYDCTALNTYNATQATAACVAYKGAGNCSTGWTCGGTGGKPLVTQPVACDNACTTCWSYGTTAGNFPTTAGTVTACTCPSTVMSVGTWD
jgi:hypothetical protein